MGRYAQQVGQAIKRQGRIIYMRTEQTGDDGPSPAIVDAPTLAANVAIGAGSVSINAATATGFLQAGDAIIVAGQTVFVTTSGSIVARTFVAGQPDGFDNVPVTPVLNAAVAAGTAVAFKWLNDKPVKAMVDVYPRRVVDGTNIAVRDLRIQVPATGAAPPAYETQKVVIDGDIRTVVTCLPTYGPGGEITKWTIQAR